MLLPLQKNIKKYKIKAEIIKENHSNKDIVFADANKRITPPIIIILYILLPIIFPTTILSSPFFSLITVVNISGKDVAIEVKVNPSIVVENPVSNAMASTEDTVKNPPINIPIIDNGKKRKELILKTWKINRLVEKFG